jgi:hypothetical protein
MKLDIRRNELCPCGSGKKFKKCCLLKEQTSRPLTREILGRACREAFSLLLDFSVKFPEPLEAPPLGRPVPELPDEAAQHTLQNELLSIWIFYLWSPPDAPAQTLPSDRTVAARFLRQAGHTLDGITRRYIEAARLEPFSYWQVESVSPGAGVLLKDLVTGEERSVADLSISRSASQWDIFFAQVVGLDGLYILNGIGLYPLAPARFRQGVAQFADDIRGRVGPTSDRLSLLRHQTEFVNHYLNCVDEMLNPTLPELRNMDGDKLVMAKSNYNFSPGRRADVIQALRGWRDLHEEDRRDGADRFVWMGMPKSPGHKDKVMKGSLAVGPDGMESECNSESRDKVLRRRLLRTFGPLLTHESTNLRPFHPGKAAKTAPDSAGKESGAIDLASLSAEDRQRIQALFEQQYMGWLDTEVPMLGGKTPRQTARAKNGKIQVAAMINDWENMQNRNPAMPHTFDFNKLRAELGIPLE